jgi:large repetitive protein
MSRRARLALVSLVLVLAGVFVASAAALRFSDDSFSMPEGVVGQSYTKTFGGAGGCGPALPYQYSILNGALPPGLALSTGGTISGTPTASGTYDFWVELSDENPPSQSWCVPATAQREFTITIDSGLSINQQSANPGTLGVPYSEQLTATLLTASPAAPGSPLATATWTVDSGTLPPGVVLSSGGLLSGTPTTEGTYTFVVRASLDATRFDTETETLVVRKAVTVQAQAPAQSEVGVGYAAQLTAAGGTGTFTWALASGTLPQGLTLDPASGAISGTPREAGRFPVQAKVTDTENRTATFDAAIVVSPRLVVPKQRLRVGKAGKRYRARLVSTGGATPRLWRITIGPLPRGLRLDRTTGVISGTPKKGGIYRITVRATDGLKVTSTRALRITVVATPKKR